MNNIPLDVKVVDPSTASNRGVPRDVRIVDADGNAAQLIFDNLEAIIAPTINDDSDDNYSIGSQWVDTVTDKAYVCVDATVGAAVWTEITAGAGGGEANTASNVGTVGTGIFKQKSGVDLQLYKLNSTSNLLTIALSGTDRIDFTVNNGNITHSGLSDSHNLTTDIDHDSLTNYSADEHFTQASITTVGTVTSGDVDAIVDSDSVGLGNVTNVEQVPLTGGTMTGQLNFSGTTHAGIKLISLTTLQRNALTPANGMLVYNSDDDKAQVYFNSTWNDWGGGGSGDVTKVGTPVNNQVGVWTGDGTIEGTTGLTFDSATDILTVGGSVATELLTISGNRDIAWAASYEGVQYDGAAATFTEDGPAATRAYKVVNSFGIPTFASGNSVTITDAANVYIAGAPAAGANTIITNAWSLWIGAGNTQFSPNVDSLHILGVAKVGYDGTNADAAAFAHYDHMTSANFGFKQESTGLTIMNAPTGQAGYFQINNSTIARFDGTGFSVGGLNPATLFEVHGVDDYVQNRTYRWSNNASGARIAGLKSRSGTPGTHTIVADADTLVRFGGYGSDGTAHRLAAEILINVDGTPGASDMPGRITFWTSPDGAIIPVERMRITQAGYVGIGCTPTNNFDVFPDTDISCTWGRCRVGFDGTNADTATFSHFDRSSAVNAALRQNGSGLTIVNASSGQTISMRINNSAVCAMTTTGFEPATDDTFYLGRNDDDTPKAWKGVILKDTTDGKYYRIEVISGAVTATDLTD